MKYFTQELWDDINSQDKAVSAKAVKEWDRNLKTYWRGVAKFRDILQPAVRKNLTEKSLHDSKILRFTANPTSLEIVVETSEPSLPPYLGVVYEDVIKLTVYNTFFGNAIVYAGSLKEWGDWGYDEISRLRNGNWQHNILTDNGREIEIVCRRMRVAWSVPKNTRGC